MAPSSLAAANATIIPVPSLSTPGDKSWKNELESIYNKIKLGLSVLLKPFSLTVSGRFCDNHNQTFYILNYTKC